MVLFTYTKSEIKSKDVAYRDLIEKPKEFLRTVDPAHEYGNEKSLHVGELEFKNVLDQDLDSITEQSDEQIEQNSDGKGKKEDDKPTHPHKTMRKDRETKKSPFNKLRKVLPFRKTNVITSGELKQNAIRKGKKGLIDSALAPVNMMDFGGQVAFYSTHQSFLTYRGIYILVLDGSKDFDDVIDTETCLPGRHGKPTSRGEYFYVNTALYVCNTSLIKIHAVCCHLKKTSCSSNLGNMLSLFLFEHSSFL